MKRVVILASVLAAISGCVCGRTCTSNSECEAMEVCTEGLCQATSPTAGGGAAGGSVAGGGAGGTTAGGRAGGAAAGGGTAGGSGGGAVAGGMTSGGSAGGMGGGDAGGAAGGMTGGGMGGGVAAPLCDGGCEVFAVCNGQYDGGRCEWGELTVIQPGDAGVTLDAGVGVSILASFRLADGGPWPTGVSIPVRTTWDAGTRVMDGVVEVVTGAQTAGDGEVVVGWAGGPQKTRSVSFVSCAGAAPSCQAYQQCVATTAGGRCENVPMAVSWVSPTGNTLERGPVNPGFSAVVRLDIDAGATLPMTLPLVLEDGGVLGPMTLATAVGVRPAQYSVNVTLNGPEGTKVLVAGWADAGVAALVATQRVFFDMTAPMVSLVAQSRPGTLPVADATVPMSWVKDEVAYVALTVTGATRGALASDIQTPGFTGNPVAAPGNCGTCTGSCVCFAVDLKDAPLAGLRGTVPVGAPSFVDAVGNASLVQMASFAVTRVKWTADVSQPGGTAVRAAPVLDPNGNLYTGTDDSLPGTTGRVVSLYADGGVRWTRAGGAVQALAAANSTIETPTGAQADVVFVAANEDSAGNKTGRLTAVLAGSGAVTGLNSNSCRVLGNPIFSAPSLMVLSGGSAGNTAQVGAFGLLNTGMSNGRVCGYSAVDGAQNGPSNTQYNLPAVPTPAASPVNLVFTGTAHVGVLEDFSGQTWTWTSSVPPAVGTSQGRGGAGPTQTGLALIPTTPGAAVTVTTQVRDTNREPIGLLGTGLQNPVYVPTDGGTFTRSAPVVVVPSSTANEWHLVGGGNPSTRDWLRVTTVTTAGATAPAFVAGPRSAVQATTPTSEELLTSPVLGDASELYAVTKAGRLYVFGVTPAGAVTYKWHGALGGSGDVVAHPTLDCNRTRGMAPGVLYSVSSAGLVTAVVVDSRKLATSPWPKWQRTAANAGSLGAAPSDFPLNPGCQ